MGCYPPIILASQEAEIGRSQFEASLGKVSKINESPDHLSHTFP
jgi:hypothetical protein